ncbi:MAG: hypothetical protein GWP17_05680 [Aquificales bacterium]|nr:hypothetical protein [Aquificales bacterium]
MPRRRKRSPIPVTLTLPAEPPTQAEIDAILMATDAIIGVAGRAGVVLILNGSKSKKALRNEWDKLPEYGVLAQLTAVKIGTLVDWCIHRRWLRIESTRDGIPLLFHTERGWERVKRLWVARILDWFNEWQMAGTSQNIWPRLENINQQIKYLLLEHLQERPQPAFAPILRAWFPHEVRKVRQAINHTLQTWGERPLPHPSQKQSTRKT